MKKYIYNVLLLLLVSCSDIPNNKGDLSLVGVYGVMSPLVSKQEVHLVRAFNADLDENFNVDSLNVRESGAEVIIQSDTQNVRLIEIKPGIYQDTLKMIQIKPGRTYRLTVKTLSGETIEAETVAPDTSALLAPAEFDTLRVTIHLDTAENELRINENPLNIRWSKANNAGSYFCSMRGDSVSVFSHNNGVRLLSVVTLFQNKKLLGRPEFQLFDIYNDSEGEEWVWTSGFAKESDILEYPLFFQINSYSMKVTDDRRRVILSNIKNGFGYFGAMIVSRKPVYVIVNATVETN